MKNFTHHMNFYIHHYGDFIIINRPKFASRILNMYYFLWLQSKFPNNSLLKDIKGTFKTDIAFENEWGMSSENGKLTSLRESQKEHFFKNLIDKNKHDKRDIIELSTFLSQQRIRTRTFVKDITNRHRTDVPIYIVYRNPYNHFRSGLLQDTSWHIYEGDDEPYMVSEEEAHKLFDKELSDDESGYLGNHRGLYLSFLMPFFNYNRKIRFINLDGPFNFDFEQLFKSYKLDLWPKKHIADSPSGGNTESEVKERSSNKLGFDYVDSYVNKNENVQRRIGQAYSSEFLWYTIIKNDRRNITI